MSDKELQRKISTMQAYDRGEEVLYDFKNKARKTGWIKAFDPSWDWETFDYKYKDIMETPKLNWLSMKQALATGYDDREYSVLIITPNDEYRFIFASEIKDNPDAQFAFLPMREI